MRMDDVSMDDVSMTDEVPATLLCYTCGLIKNSQRLM